MYYTFMLVMGHELPLHLQTLKLLFRHVASFDSLSVTPNQACILPLRSTRWAISHKEGFFHFFLSGPEVGVLWAALPLGVTPRTTVLSEFVINFKILSVKLMKSLKKI